MIRNTAISNDSHVAAIKPIKNESALKESLSTEIYGFARK